MSALSPAPADAGRVVWCWRKTAWLYAMLGPGAYGLAAGPGATSCAVGAALGAVTLCVGHSVGLHRGLIHRTFRAGPVVRGALAYLFVLSGLGGPLAWARLHATRDAWQNRPACPPYFGYAHGLARDYVWNLHCRYAAAPRCPVAAAVAAERWLRALERDRWLRFLERTWALHALGLVAALGAIGGAELALVAGCARVAAAALGHWFVGYVAHTRGRVRFPLAGAAEVGRNAWLLGLLSFGEGFHNNHHALPGSARMGVAWYELDAGYAVVRALEAARLVRGVRAWSRGHACGRAAAPTGAPGR